MIPCPITKLSPSAVLITAINLCVHRIYPNSGKNLVQIVKVVIANRMIQRFSDSGMEKWTEQMPRFDSIREFSSLLGRLLEVERQISSACSSRNDIELKRYITKKKKTAAGFHLP